MFTCSSISANQNVNSARTTVSSTVFTTLFPIPNRISGSGFFCGMNEVTLSWIDYVNMLDLWATDNSITPLINNPSKHNVECFKRYDCFSPLWNIFICNLSVWTPNFRCNDLLEPTPSNGSSETISYFSLRNCLIKWQVTQPNKIYLVNCKKT